MNGISGNKSGHYTARLPHAGQKRIGSIFIDTPLEPEHSCADFKLVYGILHRLAEKRHCRLYPQGRTYRRSGPAAKNSLETEPQSASDRRTAGYAGNLLSQRELPV